MLLNSSPIYRLLFTGGHNGKVGLYCMNVFNSCLLPIQTNSQKDIDNKLTTETNTSDAICVATNKLT